MFNDDISNAVAAPNSSSTPSSPSDHNSINDEKEAIGVVSKHEQQQKVRNENDEGQSPSEWETPATVPTATDPATTSNERKIDPKRVKR
jgi:hypothetical protein